MLHKSAAECRSALADARREIEEHGIADDLIECPDALCDLLESAFDWIGSLDDAVDEAESSARADEKRIEELSERADLAIDLEAHGYTLSQAHSMLWRNGYITQGESLGEGLVRVLDAISEGKAVG